MITAFLTLFSVIIVTLAAFIPSVRTSPPSSNAPFRTKVWFYTRKRKTLITIVGGLIGGVTGCYASLDQEKTQNSLIKKSDTISMLNREMLQLQASSKDSSIKQYREMLQLQISSKDTSIKQFQKIIQIQNSSNVASINHYKELLNAAIKQRDQNKHLLDESKKLKLKAAEMAELQKDIANQATEALNNITAKNSYAYILVHILDLSVFKTAGITIHHIGTYPLKNLQVSIINSDDELESTYDPNHKIFNVLEYGKYNHFDNPYNVVIPIISKGEIINLHGLECTFKKQKSFNVCFKADNGSVWYQRIILRRIGDYPENLIYNSASNKEVFIGANQLYKLRVRTEEERFGSGNELVNARVEVIIREGTNFLMDFPASKDKYWEIRKFSDFPKSKEERPIFSEIHKLHWAGEKNTSPITGQRVIVEY